MPALKPMLILAAENRRLRISMECDDFEKYGHCGRREDSRGRDDSIEGISREHRAILAIN